MIKCSFLLFLALSGTLLAQTKVEVDSYSKAKFECRKNLGHKEGVLRFISAQGDKRLYEMECVNSAGNVTFSYSFFRVGSRIANAVDATVIPVVSQVERNCAYDSLPFVKKGVLTHVGSNFVCTCSQNYKLIADGFCLQADKVEMAGGKAICKKSDVDDYFANCKRESVDRYNCAGHIFAKNGALSGMSITNIIYNPPNCEMYLAEEIKKCKISVDHQFLVCANTQFKYDPALVSGDRESRSGDREDRPTRDGNLDSGERVDRQ